MKRILSLIVIFAMTFTLASCEEETPSKVGPITFPAYEIENPDNNAYIEKINNTPKFKVSIDLPENHVAKNAKGEEIVPTGEFYTPVYIYKRNNLLCYIGFDVFEPTKANVPQEEYYKTVYPKLRNSSAFRWADYKAVKTTENTETGMVNIRYIAPSDLEKFAGEIPNAPVHQSFGILSYDKELGVYVGIAFMGDTFKTDTIEKIAKSVSITKID